jgi:hypothetical protein
MGKLDNSKKESSWGGKRNSAGRPKGSQNKATIEVKTVREELRQRVLANVESLIGAQLILAKGISHVFRVTIGERGGRGEPELVTDQDELHEAIDLIQSGNAYGEIHEEDGAIARYYFITTKAPDNKALDSLLDRVFGKATQSMDVTSGGLPLIDEQAQSKARAAIAALSGRGDIGAGE